MATKNVGYVVDLTGTAQVRTADGVIKVLNIGDMVSDRDLLITGEVANVVIAFNSGQRLQVGGHEEVLLDETVYAEVSSYTDEQVDELASLQEALVAMQQAILAGEDVDVLESAAAGSDKSGTEALHEASTYEREGREGEVDTRLTGFAVDGREINDSFNGDDDILLAATSGNAPVGEDTSAANTASATISVDNVTTDDIVNASEVGGDITITGSVGGDAAPGDTVNFTVNGTAYSGTVATDNTYSITVSGTDLATDNSFNVTVTGNDNAGNPFSATTTSTYGVDLAASATISIDAITADDIVNAVEAGNFVNVTGSVGGDATAGDTVSFTVNGTAYTGTVAGDSTFNISVAGSDLAADTSFDVTVAGTDNAGNPFSATTTSTHGVDTAASATITVDAITADDIVNAAESAGNVNVTGTVAGDATPGDTVSFTVNGTSYSGTVAGDNSFSISVAGSDLAADTSFDVTVAGTDGAGNPFSAATTSTHAVDTAASATITVDAITTDDIVNAAEAGGSINVTGSIGGDAAPGDAVNFTVNGTSYSGTVAAGNTFSIAVTGSDLFADTSFDVTVSGTDNAGNPFSATTTSTHTVDAGASAAIALDVIAGDDTINAIESGNDLTITGTVTGDTESGDTVVVNIGGVDYSTTVNADNTTFSVTVPTVAVGALSDGTVTATVSGTDAGGNAFTASTSRGYAVDTVSSATISVDAITSDDIVNAAESTANINVTGSVGGDATPGDTVSFTVNGTAYSGTVAADNSFSISVAGSDLAANTSFDVTVTGTDNAGNPFSETTTSVHGVDTSASATISVDAITTDDIVNAAESAGNINVTGSVAGDATPGDTVSFTVNGTSYSGTVAGDNSFSISVAGSDLAADNSFDVTVTGNDNAGNPFSETTASVHGVDLVAGATISVDAITADDIVNAAESTGNINVTGSVGGDAAAGDTVSFTVNGTNYSGTVAADNTFSIAVSGADLAADTSFDVTVSGTDNAGNPFSETTTSVHGADLVANATISVDVITADDIVNAAEAGGSINVIGSVGGDAAPGDTVSFTVNGTAYSGTVAVDNTFSISVAGGDLAADTSFDVTVTGTDSAGNPFSEATTSVHGVDLVAGATISVDAITADDIVNAAESTGSINVTGSVGGDAAPGDTVSFTVNGTNYSGTVAGDNTFSIAVLGADLAADYSFDVTVAGTDNAGNPFSETTTSVHGVDTSASATISVDNITTDDIVNAAESTGNINVTGSVGGDAAAGDTVSFTVNGTNYSGTVAADNTFSIAVLGADLAADTSFDVTVSGTDNAGNPFSATTTSTHTVDAGASAAIALDVIAGDDTINAIESGNDLTITGTVTGDTESGDTVVVNIGGVDYSTTVNADNTTFSVTVPTVAVGALSDGTVTATVSGTDAGGNAFTASTSRGYAVDTVSSATISVDAITSDDIVNAAESTGNINVTGSVGGDATPGDTVSFTVNGANYSGTVAADNSFSISVAGSDLAADTSFDVTVTGADNAGNPFSETTTSVHGVDTAASATITVDAITADDIVNAAESAGNINVTGSVGGDAAPGDTVSFTVNGTNYSGTVAGDNSFSISVAGSDLAADTSFDVTVSGTDNAGNPFSEATTSVHGVDLVAGATISVDAITADDIVNAAESTGNINVTGSVGGDAAPGDTVSFTVNGTAYSGTVAADNSFSISVAGSDLAANTSFDVTVTGTDNAGNPFSETTTSVHGVDLLASATISVDAITADDIVNAAEAGGSINVTGSIGGDATPGDTVSFTVNGTDYSGTVGAGNTFSIAVSGADLAADNSFDVTVTGTDNAGNPFSATTTSTHTVDTSASATINVDTITADDIVNAAESTGNINVTGSVAGDAAAGDTVSFTVNGTNYSGTVAGDNTFSIAVSGADLAADTSFDVSVAGTDNAGNPFNATTTTTHGVDTAASATINVDAITADNIVNAAEAGGSINVTGSIGGDAAPGDAVNFTVNGTNYSGTVAADSSFSISVAGSDLAADTSFDVAVTGTDNAGNPFSETTTSVHGVDLVAGATISVDAITADDIVNAAESAVNINVTGSVAGDAAPGDTVSFTVNGTNYSGTVAADNTFSIAVSGADLAADTSFDVSVAGTDNAGNPFNATTTTTHGVDTAASATINVDAITADDIVNAAEAGGSINVTGSIGGDAAPGDAVNFTVNGTNYSGTVAGDSSFSISVAGGDLAADTSFDVTVSGTDNAGNLFSETTTSVHGVDLVAGATISVDAITADDIVNAAESAVNINVTGSVGGDAAAGDTVSFTVNGTNYSGTVAADNTFSIAVSGADLAADNSFDVTVSGTDNAGNPFSETATSVHGVDLVAGATIGVDAITADDIVNAAESTGNINVTGSVGGDAAPGDTVSFTVNGTAYSGTVAADSSFSIAVAGSDLAADNSFDVTVSGTDNAGNPFSEATTSVHGVDLVAGATISVDAITADDIVNAAESAVNINVTGSVGGDAAAGDTVSFTVNGTNYSGTVAADNSFSISVAGSDLAADNNFDVSVAGTDNAGNPFSETTTSVHGVDTSASATINVDTITADDIVNAAESTGSINVTGSVGGDAAPGDTVSFTVNGTNYSGTVAADNTFSISVAGGDLAADTSFDVTVTGTDSAGNPFSETTTSVHGVDIAASVTITVDAITADDIVNAAEAGGSINVIGSVGGDAAPGDIVSFTVNGTAYSGTVAVDNTFSISVAGGDLAADTSFDVTVTGTDSAGNPFSEATTSVHGVDLVAGATISVDAITADDIVNAAESTGSINVTGSVGGDAAPGDTVSFTVNGANYSGTVAADNSFSISVAGSDLAADTSFDVTVTGADNAGNPFSETTTSVHGVDTAASATITVDAITADDIVNAAESAGNINVTGSVGGDAAPGDTVSFTVNGTNYSGTVAGDNSFSISVAGSDLAADTSFDVTVSGTDNAGNPFSEATTSVHGVDLVAGATISVDAITADDIVNAAEAGGSINVTGSIGGDATPGDTVSFTVNGTDYSGTVGAGNTFSIAVSGADLAADNSFDVTVTGTDNAGNPFSATTTSTHTVDTSASATINVDTITADDIVNAAESTGNINVTGSVAGDAAAGDTVSFTVNGTNYSGTVAADNTFSIAVSGADLAADTSFDVTVSGTDNAGNPFSETTTSVHGVDLVASATISVDVITADDIVNAAESAGNISVTGSVGGDAAPGDTVNFTVNGNAYSGTVAADSTFNISVAGSDLAADNSFDVTVTGNDTAGNPFSATTTSTHTVDTGASASIALDVIAGDDIINAIESGNDLTITGTVTGDAENGDVVLVNIGGVDYSTTVSADNTTFSVSVPAVAVGALSDGTVTATVSGTDAGGNAFTASTSRGYVVDTVSSATISVNDITADDIVNAAEAGGSINVTGTVGGDAAPGDTVSFTVNGANYSGMVGAGNTFSISVAGSDLAADTSFDMTVTGTDAAGNPFSETTTSIHGVDTTASATISVDAVTADDIVNAAESAGNINVTGTVGGDAAPGDTVSFSVNGTAYSGTVAADNTFNISVAGTDLAADTSFDVTVTGTDTAGNPFSATTTSTHGADTSASATISVDAITADDIVNAAESAGNINVTGSVGGDAAPGDTVSFTVNGANYSGVVGAGNTFSIAVSGADLAADTSFDATVTGTDAAGNPFSETTTSIHGVDTTASATISVDAVTADDIVNAAESAGNINVTGTVGGDAAPGDTVSFTVNSTNYSGTVAADNTFNISVAGTDLAADTSFDVTVTGTDTAGNPFSATTTSTHGADTSASATISVDAITADDIVNAAESAGNINVTGSVGGDAAPGDTVSFTVNGANYSGIVGAGNTFSIAVSGADLAADTSFDATVTGTDAAGNPFSETTTSVHGVDTSASATISVDAITTDDIVNAAESTGNINVTGSVGGDAAPGDTVSFTVNGTAYSGTVAADNSFSISVAGSDLAANTSFDVTVTGTDNAGNPFSETTTSVHGVDLVASATISVDAITADDIVNAAESAGNISVTGSVGGDAAPGDTVSFTVNGANYSGVVGAGNTFSMGVSGADLAADTSFDATVTGTDAAGNPFSETTTSVHGVDTSASATISVDAVTADDIVNAAESAGNINVTGTVGGDAAPGDTVSFSVNGTAYSGTVAADNTFNISVAGSDLAADTSFDVTVTGTDNAGNPFSETTTSVHGVDTSASATITVDAITADDIVNAAESAGNINVTGSVGGDAAAGDTVSFTVNGTAYSGTVAADNSFSISVAGGDLAADNSFDVTVTGADNAGNPYSETTTSVHGVDTSASATISVDAVTADDIVNAAESAGNINVTGTVGGDAAPGDTVSFTVNGTNYSGTVAADNSFSIAVSGADLSADNSFDVTVTGADNAGNPYSETTTSVHGVDTAASATINVDTITADDIVNAAEAGGSINVIGSVGGDAAAGDTVSFTVNGTDYSGTVAADSTFNISVAGSDLAADNSFDVTVMGTDSAGNPFSATATSTHGVDTSASATINVDTITADDIVNAAESTGNINVTGSVAGDATPGDTVSFTVNGTAYSGTVAADSSFSIAVAGSDLAADNSFDVTVSGTDNAGNPFSEATTSVHGVDLVAGATISVDAITADDIVNAAESAGNINVTGSVGGDAAAGDTVSFTVNGTAYSGTVAADSTFNISVAGSDLAANTSFDVTVTGTDNAGNPFSETTTSVHGVDTSASAAITVDAITADDIVNAAESAVNINVTGSVAGDAAPGDTVSFTVNGTAYSGTVAADSTFNISVAGGDLAADNNFDVTVTGADNAGNPYSETTTSVHGVDTSASATINVDTITADDIVNAAESTGNINVTGSVAGDATPGDTVSFTVNGTAYSGTVAADSSFSIAVAGSDLAADNSFDVTVSGTDNAGNPFSEATTSVHGVDLVAGATISVDAITADDIVNAAESTGNINVTGSVGGDAAAGDTVSFTVNGTNYSGTVAADNSFSISVAGSDLAADNNFDVTIAGTDNAGNPFSATTTSTHGVDTSASATINVDTITADDIVNAAESAGNINVTGSVGGDAAAGDTVSFTVNGTAYSGTVAADSTFNISVAGSDLAANTSFDVTVTGTDNAGNPFSETTTSVHGVDTSASAAITVDAITADDIVNAAESAVNINVTGSVAGDAAPGDTVSFTVNGTAYSGTVAADSTFNISVAGSDLAADTSFDVSVAGTDNAGNPFSETTTSVHGVDLVASATISVDAITADDIVNAAESTGNINVTGSVGGDAAPGDTVSFTVNGTAYSGTVAGDNSFSISVAGSDLAADNSFDVAVTGADNAGNPFSAATTSTHAVDTAAPATISVDAITADDIVNAAESASNINVSGSVGGDAAPGDTVSFTVNGTAYSGTVAADNSFSISVAGGDLAADTSFDVTVTGTDSAGNTFLATVTSTHGVDTSAPTITINAIAGDDIVDDIEDDSVTISGTTTGVEDGQLITVNVAGTDYTATVTGNSWSIPGLNLNGLADESAYVVTADVSDAAGNPATQATHSFTTRDTTVPVISVSAIDVAEESVNIGDVIASFSASEPDGEPLTYQLLNDPNGYFVINGNNVELTAAGVAAINDDMLNLTTLAIEVEASDGFNATSDSDISNVTRVNDAPNANDDAYTVADDTSLTTGSLSGLLINDTDAEGDTLQVTQVTISGVDYAVPASGALSVSTDNGVLDIAADGSFDYTPATGYIGTETFNYSITDGNGGSSSANFSIEVDATAEAPFDVETSLANGGYSYSVATDKDTGDAYLWRLDMMTGEITKIGTVMTADNKGYDVEGLVYDASTGYLYGAATGLRPDFLKLTIDPDEVAANGGSAVIQEYGSIAGNGNDIADVDSGNMALTIDAAGTLYLTTVKGNESVLYTVDQTTGELSSIGGMGDVVKSFDYHPDTGSFYGLITSSSKTYLHEFTLSGGSITSNQLHEIGQGLDIQGMAAGPNHNLWAVDRGTGDVLEIDIETGTVSVIVSTPVNELQGDGFESLAIGPRGNGLLAGMDFTYNLSGNFGSNNQPYETHYFLVGLSADALTNGLSVVDGQAGVSIIELAAGNVYGVNEGQYIRIEADAVLDPATGVAHVSVDLTAPLTPNDFSLPVYAVEQDLRADLNPDSNYAVTQASTDQLFPVYYDTEVAGIYTDADTGSVIRGSAGIDDISGADGDDYIYADAGNDIVSGGLGNDRLHGGDGNDTVNGGLGNDKLFGGLNDDSLLGGSGIDILNGGSGNDTLSGGSDGDTFVWSRGDEGTEIAPASDVINDFTVGAGGDVLNLSDMLQGENTGNLTDYLHFESDGNGGTVIQVDTDGGSTFAETQQITLSGVDLTVGGTFTDQVILDNLLANGNLVIDQ